MSSATLPVLDGDLLFRSLTYFRDYEDEETRGDRNEGSAVFRPVGGLVVNDQTQARPLHCPVSRKKQDEIFVFCNSRSMTDRHRDIQGRRLR